MHSTARASTVCLETVSACVAGTSQNLTSVSPTAHLSVSVDRKRMAGAHTQPANKRPRNFPDAKTCTRTRAHARTRTRTHTRNETPQVAPQVQQTAPAQHGLSLSFLILLSGLCSLFFSLFAYLIFSLDCLFSLFYVSLIIFLFSCLFLFLSFVHCGLFDLFSLVVAFPFLCVYNTCAEHMMDGVSRANGATVAQTCISCDIFVACGWVGGVAGPCMILGRDIIRSISSCTRSTGCDGRDVLVPIICSPDSVCRPSRFSCDVPFVWRDDK